MKRYLPWLIALIIRLVGATVRVSIEDAAGIFNKPDHMPIIYAFWHNRLFLIPLFYERYCFTRPSLALISRSRDGQFISDVCHQFGIQSVRGSSSRHGATAALTAIRAAGDSRVDLVITPDGPRGPCYQIQPGLIRLAQATGRPIIPVLTKLQWKYCHKTWDRFQIPIPFSACRLISLDPIYVPENATDAEIEALTKRVRDALGGD